MSNTREVPRPVECAIPPARNCNKDYPCTVYTVSFVVRLLSFPPLLHEESRLCVTRIPEDTRRLYRHTGSPTKELDPRDLDQSAGHTGSPT